MIKYLLLLLFTVSACASGVGGGGSGVGGMPSVVDNFTVRTKFTSPGILDENASSASMFDITSSGRFIFTNSNNSIANFKSTNASGGYMSFTRSATANGFIGNGGSIAGSTLDNFAIDAATTLDILTGNAIVTSFSNGMYMSGTSGGGGGTGDMGVGTIQAINYYYLNGTKLNFDVDFPSYSRSNTQYVESLNGSYNGYLDVTTLITPISTWITVGRTGSGATVIWTALDTIRAGAQWVKIKFVSQIKNTAFAVTKVNVFARSGGSLSVAGNDNIVVNLSNNYLEADAVGTIEIPISPGGTIDFRRTPSGSPTSETVKGYLVGWGY